MRIEDKKVHKEIEELILKYAEIRQKFKEYQNELKYKKYLAGNDNNIGTIGEYWAIKFIEQKKEKSILPFLEKRGKGEVSESEEWFDIELIHENTPKEYISVKTIFEDKTGTSGYIKYKHSPNNETLSIIILKLNEKLFPDELLYIENINDSLVDGMKEYKTRWNDEVQINFKYYKGSGFDKAFENIYKYCNSSDEFVLKN